MNSESLSTEAGTQESSETFRVFVTYEDALARNKAIGLCDRLMQRFWKDANFEMSWWRLDFLQEDQIAQEARVAVAQCDMMLISVTTSACLPRTLTTWIESWPSFREIQDGVLAAMIGGPEDQGRLSETHAYLREVARRAKMDYLPQFICGSYETLDGSIGAISKRAQVSSSLLDDILQRYPMHSHWGINE